MGSGVPLGSDDANTSELFEWQRMKPIDLCVFLTSFTAMVSAASIVILMRRRTAGALLNVVIALAAVAATTLVGFYLDPGISYLTLLGVLIRERDISAAVSIGLGAAAALAWWVRVGEWQQGERDAERQTWISRYAGSLGMATSIVGVVVCSQAFIWKEIVGFDRDPAVRVHVAEIAIEKIASLEFAPLRIAVAESGTVYVNYDYFETWGTVGGAIVELSLDKSTGRYQQRVVSDSTLLMRSYGLAAREGDLYVSRSGINSSAHRGHVTHENAGAVTLLKDLDGDGYFEYADDLIRGLPGARGPDTMQQNSGLTFAPDGSLFITTATAENRALDEHPWAGSVLRLPPGESQVEVFARGFRNPFGIAVGPDDQLFVTDNDIDENPGDELNHVIRGEHYGHPFVVPNERGVTSKGFRDPILVSELESNFLGLTYATSDHLPEDFRNCLYMADYMGGRIVRLTLQRDGDTYRVADELTVASVTTPLDVAAGPDGDLFVITRRTQNVYRLSFRRKSTR